MAVSFRTTLQATGGTTTGLVVPPEEVEALGGGRRPKVTATLNGYSYRTSVAFMGGEFWLGVSAEHRGKSGLKAGDALDVTLELDTAPREVEVPPDLAAALDADPSAKAAFKALSYSHKRRHVMAIADARTPETRARRIAKAVAGLSA